jgi:NTE family protein
MVGRFFDHLASPYDFNPLNINPLREYLEKTIDFAKVRACKDLKLFIAATNVRTGKIKIFERPELTTDHVMASACLPYLFPFVEIDGEFYWDGGFRGNPALFPLFYKTACPDIVIVQLDPIERATIPHSAHEIQDRMNEITFNGALMSEMRAIDFVKSPCRFEDIVARQVYAAFRAQDRRRPRSRKILGLFEARYVMDLD